MKKNDVIITIIILLSDAAKIISLILSLHDTSDLLLLFHEIAELIQKYYKHYKKNRFLM